MIPFNEFSDAKRDRIISLVKDHVEQLSGGRMDWDGDDEFEDILSFSVYADSDQNLAPLKDAVAFVNTHADERSFGNSISIRLDRAAAHSGQGVRYDLSLISVLDYLDAYEVKEIFGRIGQILGAGTYDDGTGNTSWPEMPEASHPDHEPHPRQPSTDRIPDASRTDGSRDDDGETAARADRDPKRGSSCYTHTRAASQEWHDSWAKQRAAFAYMRDELRSIDADEDDRSASYRLLDRLDACDVEFLRAENALLMASRARDRGDTPNAGEVMLAALTCMRTVYQEPFQALHALIQKAQDTKGSDTLSLLLTALSADALHAHAELIDALDDFKRPFEV